MTPIAELIGIKYFMPLAQGKFVKGFWALSSTCQSYFGDGIPKPKFHLLKGFYEETFLFFFNLHFPCFIRSGRKKNYEVGIY